MNQDWEIKSLSPACRACETPFEDRQQYHSVLVFSQEGYVRHDYCDACWATWEAPASAHSKWQGIFRVPPPPPEPALRKETAETLLRRLIEENNEAHRNVVYILAVMLERKRLLVERKVQKEEGGRMVRVYEHRKSGDTFLIPEPQIRMDELEQVQQEVVTMLSGGEKKEAPADNADEPAEAKAAPAAAAGTPEDSAPQNVTTGGTAP